jgi:hypothetical protein
VTRVVEFFFLRASMAASSSIDDDVRGPLRRDLALAARKREAAFAVSHRDPGVDAERLATDALDAAVSALSRVNEKLDPSLRASLEATVEAARHPAHLIDFDAHDGEANTRAPQIARLLAAQATLHEAIEPLAMTRSELARARLNRVTLLLTTTALLIGVPYFVTRPPRNLVAEASASYGGEFLPQNVIDEQAKTEWLLPNGQLGWIDLQLAPPRSVSKLRLLNGHNAQYFDRAAKDLKITAYCEGGAAETQYTFPEFSETPSWVTIPLGGKGKCSRVRIEVTSFHRVGSSIAEVELD